MTSQVNILYAKTNLSKLIQNLENHEAERVIIARNGQPVAQLSLIQPQQSNRRLGVARGKLNYRGDWDAYDADIADMFEGGSL